MRDFIAGALFLGYAVSALFFGRFYRETRDRLFLWFVAGFVLLALQRLGLAVAESLPIPPLWHYVIRLVAFLLILAAIVDKNRSA